MGTKRSVAMRLRTACFIALIGLIGCVTAASLQSEPSQDDLQTPRAWTSALASEAEKGKWDWLNNRDGLKAGKQKRTSALFAQETEEIARACEVTRNGTRQEDEQAA